VSFSNGSGNSEMLQAISYGERRLFIRSVQKQMAVRTQAMTGKMLLLKE
jgi:hypothetical protein